MGSSNFRMVPPRNSLPISLSHNTKLAIAIQRSQSPVLRPTVPNACCRAGTYTTVTCTATDNASAAQSYGLVNSPTNALMSSERALMTLKIWNSISVVNAIACA